MPLASAPRLALLAATAVIALASAAQAREVRIFNWSDYIDAADASDSEILKEFTAETGIQVIYDVYPDNETLDARLKAGQSGYDVVVPTASFMSRQIKAGMYQKLDKSKLPNLANMWPEIAQKAAVYDPDNEYSVTYMWGTTGIGYIPEKVLAILPDAPVDSWSLVFDPEVVSKLSSCGVMMLDSAEDVMPSVLNYLGINPDTKDPAHFAQAAAHLESIRPYIRKFHSDEWKQAIANGEICVALGYSGDVFQYAAEAEEAGKDFTIEYVIPIEGAQLWFDQLAIPADAPNPAEAHEFINFMMRPDIIARATNYVAYANGNSAATELVDEEIRTDPRIYPTPDVLNRLYTVSGYDEPRVQRELQRAWTRAKTGQ